MRIAIDALRARTGSDQPIMVYHVDLPVNDFNTLFRTRPLSRRDVQPLLDPDSLLFPC